MASNDTEKSVFVVTFPLKTEAWQEDRINKMMRLLAVLSVMIEKVKNEKCTDITT